MQIEYSPNFVKTLISTAAVPTDRRHLMQNLRLRVAPTNHFRTDR